MSKYLLRYNQYSIYKQHYGGYRMSTLIRFGISMEDELLKQFDRYIIEKNYSNRSEAIRDLIRDNLIRKQWADPNEQVLGSLTIVYDHHQRKLVDKLLDLQHDSSCDIVATMHVHVDHHNCMEMMVLRGTAATVREVADKIIATKGVKHGKLHTTTRGEGLH